MPFVSGESPISGLYGIIYRINVFQLTQSQSVVCLGGVQCSMTHILYLLSR